VLLTWLHFLVGLIEWLIKMAFPVGSTYQKLAIDNTKVSGGSNLVDFPVLIADGNIKDATYLAMQGDGDDIRITTDLAGENEVPFEIVVLDAGAKTCEIWTKLTVDHDDDTEFYIWFGDPALSAYAVDAEFGRNNVWTSDYKAVLHLNESDGSPIESCGLVAGTFEGDLPTNIPVKIKDGQNLNGSSDYIELANDADLDCVNQTISFWLKADDLATIHRAFYTRRTGNTDGQMIFLFLTSDTINWDTAGSAKRWSTDYKPPTDGSVVLLTFTFDGSVKRLYVNGVLQDNTASDVHSLLNPSVVARIGADTSSARYFVDGGMDEFRLIGATRPVEWILTEFNNQDDPDSFITGYTPFVATENKLKYYRRTRFPGPVTGL